MRRALFPLLFLGLIAAKGSKKTEEPAPAAEPAPAPAAAPAAEAPPAEEPAPAPVEEVVVKNADFNITITYASGAIKSGHVRSVERTVDFYGDSGWTTSDSDLRLVVESGTSEKQVSWKDVKTIGVVVGKMPDDVDCTYSSDFTPWMYDCTIRTTTTATMKDGSKGNVTNRHRWRLTLDDGTKIELQVYKYSIREQDSRTVEFGDEQTENFALYTKLQDQLRTAIKTDVVKSITVQ